MLSSNKKFSKKAIRSNLNIAIASDHGGFLLKNKIKKILTRKNYEVNDFGAYTQASCDYPKLGIKLIRAILNKEFNRGILVCRSGIGFSILANRFKGIRAALCYNAKAAELSRKHNNSNILILAGDFIKPKDVEKILDIWLNSEFEGGRHLKRLRQIEEFSKRRGNE